jgi:ATP-dependent RNA helicase DeaD
MPIGRQNNADPKWLIPLICRLGHVTKKDIGQIRIFDRETKFEIVAETEARFRQAVKGAAEGDIRIEPAAAPPAADRPRGPRPQSHQSPRPHAAKPHGPKPHAGPPKGKPKRRPNSPQTGR